MINNHIPKAHIYLYGSRARGDNTKGSDVDLALDMEEPIDSFTMSTIKEEIEESTLPLFVDLIDVHSVSQDFLDEIKKDWVKWQ